MAIVIAVAVFIVLLGLVLYAVGVYNQLVQINVNVARAWSNIEVLEKQRYDEIPNLVRVCEGYIEHERTTLENVTAARTSFMQAKTPGQVAEADSRLAGALKTLFAVSENYPSLKADSHFLQLQKRVSDLENQIADRREFYNDSVAIFNTRIRQIPYVFFTGLLGFTAEKEMYKVAEAEKAVPQIRFNGTL